METCPYCGEQFEVEVSERLLGLKTLLFDCPSCRREFESYQLEKIVWKRDTLFGNWYTCLVPRHTKVDGINLVRFDYFDYMKTQ